MDQYKDVVNGKLQKMIPSSTFSIRDLNQACVTGRHKEVDNMQEIKRTTIRVKVKSIACRTF